MVTQPPARRRPVKKVAGVTGTQPLPVVKPKGVSVAPVDVVKVQVRPLTDNGQIPEFKTNELTSAMIAEVVASKLDGAPSLHRTEAGIVTMGCGLTADGRVIVSIKHWRSFNGAQTYDTADDDQGYQVEVKLGAMVPIREPEVLPDVIEGDAILELTETK